MPLTKLQAPWTTEYGMPGSGLKTGGNTAEALKRAGIRSGKMEGDLDSIDNKYNKKVEAFLDEIDPGGQNGYGKGRWAKMLALKAPDGTYALDSRACGLLRTEAAAIAVANRPVTPDIGPVFHGGPSVLDHCLTHPTDGIALYPAFDDAFQAGMDIIAPELLTVTRPSHSHPGMAFYASGESGLDYWFGHLDRTHYDGEVFRKGYFLGNVLFTTIGGGSHCHVGINAERILGKGQQLLHHDNYTLGAPMIRKQLEGKWK